MIHISAGIRQTALHALGLSLGSRRIQRSRKSNPVNSPSVSDTAIDSVLVHDQVLAVSVDKKTDQVRAHIVTAEIGQRFGKMDLVEVNLFDDQLVDILAKKKKKTKSSSTYVNEKQSLEVFVGVRNEVLSIRSKDTAISIVDVGILKLFSRRCVELDSLRSNCLPRRKSERTGLDRVRRGNKLSGLVSNQTYSSQNGKGGNIHLRLPRPHWCMGPGT